MADQSYFDLVYYVTKQIPKGRVTNYGAIADYLSLGSARMVGWALTQANRSAETTVPAHRVVNRKGELSGRNNFATPSLMQELLEAEGIKIENDRVVGFETLLWHPENIDAKVKYELNKMTTNNSLTKRINLISGPRNISTAMMYAWANRPDTKVVDEPMYAYYLQKTGIDYHPATQETLASLPCHWSAVIEQLMLQPIDAKIYFIKGMAHHYLDDDLSFLLQLENIFLIRDPRQLIASFSKVIEQPTMQDIGLKREWELYQYLIKNGQTPLVLDSNQVLNNPKEVLTSACKYLGVPFDKAMLSWPAGSIAEDGAWAPHWYHSVWKSKGWAAPDNSLRILREELLPLYEEAMIYYSLMSQKLLTV